MSTEFIDTTSHDFKNHFSEYVRLLQENRDTVITVYKYKTPIGFFIPYDANYEASAAKEADDNQKQPRF